MSTARIYTRLSRDKADQDSTARQEAEARALASRLGFEDVQVYAEEPGTLGYADVARPKRDRLVADLRPGDLAIAWAFDRLTRRGMEDAGRLLRLVEEAGAHVVTVSDGVDTRQDLADLSVGVRAILAREESRRISSRVRSAKRTRREDGRWLGGPAPYGLRVVDGVLAHDPTTYPTARRIADGLLGGATLWAVVADLNAEGVPAPRGGSWRVPSLAALVRSPGWAGLQSIRRRTASGGLAAVADVYTSPGTGQPVTVGVGVVTPSERSRILRALDRRTADARGTRADGSLRRTGRRVSTALLGDVARCALCGSRVTLSGSSERRSYRCASAAQGAGRCRGITAPEKALDDYVASAFRRRLAASEPTDDLLLAVAEAWVESRDPDALAARTAADDDVASAREALARLQRLAIAGVLSEVEAAE